MEIDAEIHRRLNVDKHGYEGSKSSPQSWAIILEEYPKFAEGFNRVFNNDDIPE